MTRRILPILLSLCVLFLAAVAFAEEDNPLQLTEADLILGELSFSEATLEDCMTLYGTPVSDSMSAFSGVIKLEYNGFTLEFLPDKDGTPSLEALIVTEDTFEGPRGLRIEDSQESVVERFGPSEEDDMFFYSFEAEDGRSYGLSCSFSGEVLTEYRLYGL